MPPKEKYSYENIMDAAFELAREEGLEQITVRNIAAKLGCSTQPIYSSFGSIEKLEEKLIDRIKYYAQSAILSYDEKKSHFLAMGLGYFTFAQTEPMLFISLFIHGGWKWNFTKEDPFFSPILKKMKKDKFLEQIDDEKLAELFRDMFIYTHGLATQSQMSDEVITIESARALLMKMGTILIASASITDTFDIDKLMRRIFE